MVVHFEVVGMVQGVGYRWFVRERARQIGVAGWVRNLPNGNVEIAASGDDDAVMDLLNVARQGPPAALVTGVNALPVDGLADLPNPFTVLR
jgi:acylphosphatase